MTSKTDQATTGPAFAGSLVRLGLAGFWIQFVMLIVILFLTAYVARLGGAQAARYLDLGNWASFLALALPVFTTWWLWRYATAGRRIRSGGAAPAPGALRRMLWIGVWVGAIGATLSLLMMFGAVTNLLYVLVTAPQVGVMISPAGSGGEALSVSAIDAVSLLSLLLTLTSELMVIALSFRLLFLVGFAPDARKG